MLTWLPLPQKILNFLHEPVSGYKTRRSMRKNFIFVYYWQCNRHILRRSSTHIEHQKPEPMYVFIMSPLSHVWSANFHPVGSQSPPGLASSSSGQICAATSYCNATKKASSCSSKQRVLTETHTPWSNNTNPLLLPHANRRGEATWGEHRNTERGVYCTHPASQPAQPASSSSSAPLSYIFYHKPHLCSE